MTNRTRDYLIKSLNLNENKITKIDNPIISRKIKILSTEKLMIKIYLFWKKGFLLYWEINQTKELSWTNKRFANFSKKNGEGSNLIILGEGEDEQKLKKFINEKNIKNCFLLGFKRNPYRYLSKSKLYICTSLWEEPGHTLIESDI